MRGGGINSTDAELARHDLTEEERELGQVANEDGLFQVMVDRSLPPPREVRVVSRSGRFRREISYSGTVAECHAWLTGWVDRTHYDQADLAKLDEIRAIVARRS